MLGGAKHYAYLTDEVFNDPKLLAGVAGVFAPLAERTLLHAPRSVEQGPLRRVQHPRFNNPPPRGVRKGPKALPSKDFKKVSSPVRNTVMGLKKKHFPFGARTMPMAIFSKRGGPPCSNALPCRQR